MALLSLDPSTLFAEELLQRLQSELPRSTSSPKLISQTSSLFAATYWHSLLI